MLMLEFSALQAADTPFCPELLLEYVTNHEKVKYMS